MPRSSPACVIGLPKLASIFDLDVSPWATQAISALSERAYQSCGSITALVIGSI